MTRCHNRIASQALPAFTDGRVMVEIKRGMRYDKIEQAER